MASNQSFVFQTPPPKRMKLQEDLSSEASNVSDRVLHLSNEIRSHLNVKEAVNKTLLSESLDFLTKKEHRDVLRYRKNYSSFSDIDIIDYILFALKWRNQPARDEDCRRFVACIVKAATAEHHGNRELAKIFKHKLERNDLLKIQTTLDQVKLLSYKGFVPPCTSPPVTPFQEQTDTVGSPEESENEHICFDVGSTTSVSERVLRLSDEIRKYLNVKEVLSQTLLSERLDFLRKKEYKHVLKLQRHTRPLCDIIDYILFSLKLKDEATRDESCRRFVACIVKADSHSGHWELANMFNHTLERKDLEQIKEILDKVQSPSLPSPCTSPPHSPLLVRCATYKFSRPAKPVPLIQLEGKLMDIEFVKIERELWFAFSSGNYEQVKVLAKDVQLQVQCGTFNEDCQVVAMWFESLVMMHRDGQYDSAIKLLQEAELLTKNCVNEHILKGRIHQRMAQIFLMMPDKKAGAAAIYFKMAKEELQFVGRGYDKTNMYCREAKILSATEPHRRDDIEKVYEKALCTLEKDDPYFLASYPSVSLSKTAFHLHVAFGAKPYITFVSAEDIRKAKDTLRNVNEEEHILIDMRRREYNFLVAELCRLEGNHEEACSMFQDIIKTADSKVTKILDLAGQRRDLCESHLRNIIQ